MGFRLPRREAEVALTLAVAAITMCKLALKCLSNESSRVCGFTGLRVAFLRTTAAAIQTHP